MRHAQPSIREIYVTNHVTMNSGWSESAVKMEPTIARE
jgi:hypothetical protein